MDLGEPMTNRRLISLGLLSAALLVGCKEEVCGVGGDFTSPPFDRGDEDEDEDQNNDWLFSLERINRIELTLGDEAVRTLSKERTIHEDRFEVPGELSIDGVNVGTIGVRLRGRLGSFQRFVWIKCR